MIHNNKLNIFMSVLVLIFCLSELGILSYVSEVSKTPDKMLISESDRNLFIPQGADAASFSLHVSAVNFPFSQKNQNILNQNSIPKSEDKNRSNNNNSFFVEKDMNIPQNSFIGNSINRIINFNHDIILKSSFYYILSDYSISKIHSKRNTFLLINPVIHPNIENYSLLSTNIINC